MNKTELKIKCIEWAIKDAQANENLLSSAKMFYEFLSDESDKERECLIFEAMTLRQVKCSDCEYSFYIDTENQKFIQELLCPRCESNQTKLGYCVKVIK